MGWHEVGLVGVGQEEFEKRLSPVEEGLTVTDMVEEGCSQHLGWGHNFLLPTFRIIELTTPPSTRS